MINSPVQLLTSSAWTLPDSMSDRLVWNRIALVLYEFCAPCMDGRDWSCWEMQSGGAQKGPAACDCAAGWFVCGFVYGCIAPMAGGSGLVVPLKSVVIPEMAIPEPMAGLEEVMLGLIALRLDSLTRPGSAQV
jgi:hypothetical protein